MATNQAYEPEGPLYFAVPSGTVSGNPVVLGQLPGVALIDRDTAGNATVDCSDKVWRQSVKGIDGSGNAAVAAGDILYHTAADSPPLSKKATGVRWGYALDAVSSGATTTIRVRRGY